MFHPHLAESDALLLGIALIVVVVLVVIGCISKGSL